MVHAMPDRRRHCKHCNLVHTPQPCIVRSMPARTVHRRKDHRRHRHRPRLVTCLPRWSTTTILLRQAQHPQSGCMHRPRRRHRIAHRTTRLPRQSRNRPSTSPIRHELGKRQSARQVLLSTPATRHHIHGCHLWAMDDVGRVNTVHRHQPDPHVLHAA